jgi:hypothetical protein
MNRKRKSQAAMEFLMTYGWALLVVLIVITALVFFGILNPDLFFSDRMDVPPGFDIVGAFETENLDYTVSVSSAENNYNYTYKWRDYINDSFDAQLCVGKWGYNNNSEECSSNIISLGINKSLEVGDLVSNSTSYALGGVINFNLSVNDSQKAISGIVFGESDPHGQASSGGDASIEIYRQAITQNSSGYKSARIYLEFDDGGCGASSDGKIYANSNASFTIFGADGFSGVPEEIMVANFTKTGSNLKNKLDKNADGTYNWTVVLRSNICATGEAFAYLEFTIPLDRVLNDVVFSVNEIYYIFSTAYQDRVYIGGSVVSSASFPSGDSGKAYYPSGTTFNSALGKFPIYLPLSPGERNAAGGFAYVRLNKTSLDHEIYHFNNASADTITEADVGNYSLNHLWQTVDSEIYNATACVSKWMHNNNMEVCSQYIVLTAE